MSGTWYFQRHCMVKSGHGVGYELRSRDGLTMQIPHNWRGLVTSKEAVDWANMYVRLLDDTEVAMSDGYRHGA